MAPPRLLTSLPSDVLLEILSHLLVDTPHQSNRASILRACSLLYELGLPLLYRVVDLRGFSRRALVLEHWRRLFGEGGLLIEGGRKVELARTVKEIRLGAEPYRFHYDDKVEESLSSNILALSSMIELTLLLCFLSQNQSSRAPSPPALDSSSTSGTSTESPKPSSDL